MNEKKLEDLLSILDSTDDLKHQDEAMSEFVSFVKTNNISPGKYKTNIELLTTKYKRDIKPTIEENYVWLLKEMGFQLYKDKMVYLKKEDKERLTLDYAEKISEKVYKDE